MRNGERRMGNGERTPGNEEWHAIPQNTCLLHTGSQVHAFFSNAPFLFCHKKKKNRTVDRRLGKRGPTSARWISQTKSEARAIGVRKSTLLEHRVLRAVIQTKIACLAVKVKEQQKEKSETDGL